MTHWPTYFIPHGGGPCFFMDPPAGLPKDTWDSMADFLKGMDDALGARPKAVLVISAHWQTKTPAVHVGETPDLLFDYYGFPAHTYELTYPVKGDPSLAAHVQEVLAKAGWESKTEHERGLDHGLFIPFKLIYPEADVPMVQLSMPDTSDPNVHLAFGRALAPLRDEGVLIVGSGLSYHNLREFFSGRTVKEARAFDDWIHDAVIRPDDRNDVLLNWEDAPGARISHPTPEHFLPLLIAAGAATGDPATRVYSGEVAGNAVSGYRFG